MRAPHPRPDACPGRNERLRSSMLLTWMKVSRACNTRCCHPKCFCSMPMKQQQHDMSHLGHRGWRHADARPRKRRACLLLLLVCCCCTGGLLLRSRAPAGLRGARRDEPDQAGSHQEEGIGRRRATPRRRPSRFPSCAAACACGHHAAPACMHSKRSEDRRMRCLWHEVCRKPLAITHPRSCPRRRRCLMHGGPAVRNSSSCCARMLLLAAGPG